MGFWGTLLGIGGDIAGAAIGAPWLGTAITAGANAITGSDAASTAAQQQQAGAQQALALQRPAMSIGQGALAQLGSLYGLAQPSASSIGNVNTALQAVMTGVPSSTQPINHWTGQPRQPVLPQPTVMAAPNGIDPASLEGLAKNNTSSYGA